MGAKNYRHGELLNYREEKKSLISKGKKNTRFAVYIIMYIYFVKFQYQKARF